MPVDNAIQIAKFAVAPIWSTAQNAFRPNTFTMTNVTTLVRPGLIQSALQKRSVAHVSVCAKSVQEEVLIRIVQPADLDMHFG
jgi:hypothetical protein